MLYVYKMRKKNCNLIVYTILCVLLLPSLVKYHDLLILSPTQGRLLNDFQNGFSNGTFEVKNLNSEGVWDEVCLASAYSILEDIADIGYIDRFKNLNPYSMFYGLGFIFLEGGKVTKYIHLPSVYIDNFSFSGRFIKTSSNQNQNLKGFYLSDLNIIYEKRHDMCAARESGAIRFIGRQEIRVEE